MDIDRKAFLESLGGAEGVARMDSEARADATRRARLRDRLRMTDIDVMWNYFKTFRVKRQG